MVRKTHLKNPDPSTAGNANNLPDMMSLNLNALCVWLQYLKSPLHGRMLFKIQTKTASDAGNRNKFVFNLQRLRNLACEILLRPFLTFFYEIHPNFHLHVQHQPDLQHLEGALQQELPLFIALNNFYEITSQACYRLVE